MRTAAVASALLASFFSAPAIAAEFTSDSPIETNTGYALVEWDSEGPVTLELARRSDLSDARSIYRGDFDSYFLSGLADGDYYLRLRGADGSRSAPLAVEVAHQSLTKAIWLMIAGALVTIGIVASIWRGARDE